MYLTSSFPHFHRRRKNSPCGNVENFVSVGFFHNLLEISTTISTGAVDSISFSINIKVTFPHFHRPYYYYYI